MDLEEFTTRLQSIASNKPGWLPQIRAVVVAAATKLSAQAEATGAATAVAQAERGTASCEEVPRASPEAEEGAVVEELAAWEVEVAEEAATEEVVVAEEAAAPEATVVDEAAAEEAAAVADEAVTDAAVAGGAADYSNASYWSPSPAYDVSELLGDDEATAEGSAAAEEVTVVEAAAAEAATEALTAAEEVAVVEPAVAEAATEEPAAEEVSVVEQAVAEEATEALLVGEPSVVEGQTTAESELAAAYSNASYWSPSPAYDVSELLGDDEAVAEGSTAAVVKGAVAAEEPAVAEDAIIVEEPVAQGEATPTADYSNASYWNPSPAYDVSDLLGDNEAAAGVTEEATQLAEQENQMRQGADEEVAAQQAAAQRLVDECAARLDATEPAEEAVGMKASDKQTSWEDTQEVAVASDVEESDEFGDTEDMTNAIFRESVEIDAQRGSEKLAARFGLVHASHQLILL